MLYYLGEAMRVPSASPFILYANVRVCDGENERERRPTTAALSPTTTFIYLPFFVTYLSTRRYTMGAALTLRV